MVDLKIKNPTFGDKIDEELLIDKERPTKKAEPSSCVLSTFLYILYLKLFKVVSGFLLNQRLPLSLLPPHVKSFGPRRDLPRIKGKLNRCFKFAKIKICNGKIMSMSVLHLIIFHLTDTTIDWLRSTYYNTLWFQAVQIHQRSLRVGATLYRCRCCCRISTKTIYTLKIWTRWSYIHWS